MTHVCLCATLVSYNCESCDFSSLVFSLGRVGFGIVDGRVRGDGAGGMEGHVSRDCTMEQKAKSCYRCGREGHIVRWVSSPSLLSSCDLVRALPAKYRIAVA